ncbi:DNA-directed RNA polymerase III subunit RPC9 [Ophiocordyceps camponoti-floridani]|uniref:DNA-directed RNA polymerase III subunit RPC9 n=1 Tax=Ophiocordyceps camponoti-floridani TaxID=2030778 RepID=A0A8H4Q407_9HYPO|nr:DNA-directed RNA polymerase III subunit RPC9 [Ophiocordyceps camponoti-floridani]
MRIVESQSAVLTNYEVFQHLVDQRRRYQPTKRRGPGNLETVVKEVLVYMRERPSPLCQEPVTYKAECVARLLERLRPYDLSKGEVIMMFNHRPPDVAHLNTLVEDMSDRFSPEQQQEIVHVVADVLGRLDDGEQQTDTGAAAA